MSDGWEQDLKEAEDNLNLHVKELGKLKTEYDHNLYKLRESYYPKMRPLKVQVYKSIQVRRMIEKKIRWLEAVEAKRGVVGKAFQEAVHMEGEREEFVGEAEPLFTKAIEVLRELRKEDLAVMRNYEHPPQLVLETMEAVMLLRGDESGQAATASAEKCWEEAKYLLCDTYFFAFFVSKAKSFDRSRFTPEILEKLSKFVTSPDFEPATVADASVPCTAICAWLRALYEIGKLQEITIPATRSDQELSDELEAAKKDLHLKAKETAGAEQKLTSLQREFEQRRYDLKDRYDHTMSPLQDRFLEAHNHYGETFCSPRRQRFAPDPVEAGI